METVKSKPCNTYILPFILSFPAHILSRDSINFIKSPKMIKLYTCSEQKKLTEIGKKSE